MGSTVVLQNRELSAYIKQIEKFPVLSETEEKILAEKWINNQDKKAAHKLVTSHLRLVVKIAFQFKNYGFSLMELVAEGSVGLMKAVRNFDPKRGYRVSTYAMWWIKSSIQEYILKAWSLVKIGTTGAQRKLFYNLRKLKKKSMDNSQIAEALSVDESQVAEMERTLSEGDRSLDQEYDDHSLKEVIANPDDNQEILYANQQESDYKKGLLVEAIQSLDDRYREIIVARKLQETPMTLSQLSKQYDVSCERIRQIESQALNKIKKFIQSKCTDVDVI